MVPSTLFTKPLPSVGLSRPFFERLQKTFFEMKKKMHRSLLTAVVVLATATALPAGDLPTDRSSFDVR